LLKLAPWRVDVRTMWMTTYMRLFGAPSDVAERRDWAKRHPLRSSLAAALLMDLLMGAIALFPRGNLPLAVLVAICAAPVFFVLGVVSLRMRRG
jgi:hypothetical protein